MEISSLRRRRMTDLLVVALALLSVVLLGASAFLDLGDQQRLTVFWVDVGICVLFLLEFLAAWRGAGFKPVFVLRNWYDVLSMVPVAHPYFTESGWTGLLWVLVVLARIGRGADRLVGERVTAALTTRVTTALVDTIKQPITVEVLDEVAAVLQTGNYTENLASALRENEEQIKTMVREKLDADPLAGHISLLPFHGRVVDTVSETTLRVIFDVLDDPRTDELVSDVLRVNILQLREQVRRRDYRTDGPATTWIEGNEPPAPSRKLR